MITITDAQQDNILHQTSRLIDFANSIHNTFSVSTNISDKAISEWHNTLYQATAILENLESQVQRIEKMSRGEQ